MKFSLRTLLLVTTLAAIVATGFAMNLFVGIFAYLACFSLFMLVWRMRLVCQQIDQHPPDIPDPFLPWRLLFEALGLGFAASMAFCAGCMITQLPFTPILTTAEHYRAVERQVHLAALLLSIPVGTLAALFVYWLSWPALSELEEMDVR